MTRRYRVGPVQVDLELRELLQVLRGARAVLRRHGGPPIDPDRIPEGWHLAKRQGRRREWPTGWTRNTDFWVAIWWDEKYGAHLTIKPSTDGWRVVYDPENTWMGGEILGGGFTLEEAVAVAIDAMERLNDGATKRDLLFTDYEEWAADTDENEDGETDD